MNRFLTLQLAVAVLLNLIVTGCEKKVTAQQNAEASTGPAPAPVEPDMDPSNFKVEHPEQFPLVTAKEYTAVPELNVTGVVQPDVSRQVPVPSLA